MFDAGKLRHDRLDLRQHRPQVGQGQGPGPVEEPADQQDTIRSQHLELNRRGVDRARAGAHEADAGPPTEHRETPHAGRSDSGTNPARIVCIVAGRARPGSGLAPCPVDGAVANGGKSATVRG